MIRHVHIVCIVPLLALLFSIATPALAMPQYQTGDLPTPGCQWAYSTGGQASFANLFKDSENTPLDDLYFGEAFSAGDGMARVGYLDFDGDGTHDVFRVTPRLDGLLQWQYAPDSRSGWLNLAYAARPVSDLQFGDFNADGKSDVFAIYANADGGQQWVYSSGGTANFQTLKEISADEVNRYSLPRIADFNGDGAADIFVAEPRQAGGWQWKYAPSGSGAFTQLAYAFVDPASLQFGDFDSDGKSDIFTGLPQTDGSQQWVYSPEGAGDFIELQSIGAAQVAEFELMRLGDFDGDGKTDVFIATARPDGAWQWAYSAGGTGAISSRDMNYATIPPHDLRFGKFGVSLDYSTTDVFALLACDSTTAPIDPLTCGGTFAVQSDATVRQDAAFLNFGLAKELVVGQQNGDESRALLQFDFDDSLPDQAAIYEATLELTLVDPSQSAVYALRLQDVADWGEESVNWDNQPATETDYDARAYSGFGGKARIDVTAWVMRRSTKEGGRSGILLSPAGNDDFMVAFASREQGAMMPQLVIRCIPPLARQNRDMKAIVVAQLADYQRMEQASLEPVTMRYSGQGSVAFALLRLPLPTEAGNNAPARALWFINAYKALFRLDDPPTQLQFIQYDESNQNPRFRQIQNGVPIYPADIVIHLDGNDVVGITADYWPTVGTLSAPLVSAAQAIRLALLQSGENGQVVGTPQLRIVVPDAVGIANGHTRLVWQVGVLSNTGNADRFVDAHSGEIILTESRTRDVFDLNLWSGNGVGPTAGATCWNGSAGETLWYTERGVIGGVTPNADGQAAFTAIQAVYNFWRNSPGIQRDSYQANGNLISLFVSVGNNWRNANYSPTCDVFQFGANMTTQDLIGHEFTHGVVRSTVGLRYQNQSGALDESFADIFGYFVDSNDWTIGEGSAIGAVRDLSNPGALSFTPPVPSGVAPLPPVAYPDLMSEYYTHPLIPNWDFGAVHENSSIHNKVAFLLINGGLYNERQIRALGSEKAWRLFYGILRNNRLNANSGFLAVRDAAVAEARALAQQGIFTDKGKDNDLCQVRNAYAAVEIGAGDANCDGIEDLVVGNADDDHDGVFNQYDNCPAVWNPGQSYQLSTDLDNDKLGDACDQDRDGDAICDEGGPFTNVNRPPNRDCAPGKGTKNLLAADNCLGVPNPDQADRNNNGIGDRCDDSDGDGRMDADDNCPSIRQVTPDDWRDTDGDTVGDLCDNDDDNDGQADTLDNCPLVKNYGDFGMGEDTTETDRGLPADNVGDACDLCPFVSSPDNTESDYPPDGFANPCDADDDNDAICDQGGPLPGGVDGVPAQGCKAGKGRVSALDPTPADNCPRTYNPDQLDSDQNGIGYACDALERRRLTHEFNNVAKQLVLVADGLTRIPLPVCPECVANNLPQQFESVVKIQIPDGFTAQVIDNRGDVVARSVPTDIGHLIRFHPTPYAITRVGGIQAAENLETEDDSLAADAIAYYLEFIPLSTQQSGDTVAVTVTIDEVVTNNIYLPFISR